MKGEEWKPAGLGADSDINKKRARSLHPPKKPPPRPATQESSSREVTHEAISMEITEESTGASNSQNVAPSWAAADKKPTRPPPRPRGANREGIQTPDES